MKISSLPIIICIYVALAFGYIPNNHKNNRQQHYYQLQSQSINHVNSYNNIDISISQYLTNHFKNIKKFEIEKNDRKSQINNYNSNINNNINDNLENVYKENSTILIAKKVPFRFWRKLRKVLGTLSLIPGLLGGMY